MATKAQIQTRINEINTGGLNTALEVRNVLGTNTASFLENIYGSIVEDTHTSETVTIANANFNYRIIISKVGRMVTVTGDFQVLNNVIPTNAIFGFSDAQYATIVSQTSSGFAQGGNTVATRIYILDNFVRTSRVMFTGESYNFTLTYPVKD